MTKYSLILILLSISINSFSTNSNQFFGNEIENIIISKGEVELNGSIKIPLFRSGNLFLLDGEVDGMEGKFILDLGAPYLILNSTYFRDYTIDENVSAGSILSNSGNLKRASVDHFSFFGIKYENIEADVTFLGEIENQKGIQILGLMGVRLFKDYVIEINTLEKELVLYPDKSDYKIDSKVFMSSEFELVSNIIMLKVKLAGREYRFSIDSGAETNILANNLPSTVYNNISIRGISQLTDSNGNNTEVLIGTLNSITVGDYDFLNSYTVIMNLKFMNKAYKKPISGMLGFPFFAMGKVLIDFKKKQISMSSFN